MVLNTTGMPFFSFSAMQRLALNGESLETHRITTLEQFERIYEPIKAVVTKVIIDPEDFVLANDILNYVACEVVTLDTESIVDTNEVKFLTYDEKNYDL